MNTISTVSAVYVHVPYCHTICGYCDFYSEVLDESRTEALVTALLSELESYGTRVGIDAETIFVGGGTPTTLPAEQLERLLRGLRRYARKGVEFSVEANPATVSAEVAEVLRSGGVTRVSIGAQSFDAGELRVLERIHRPAQVEETVARLRGVGIENINLDLIFGIPGQSLERWKCNLRAALAMSPEHLSCYGLTYEPGTPLYERLRSGAVVRLNADAEAAMYESTIDGLASAGYEQYEISNFARPGRRCRHNLVYWHNEPAVGIGPSAAGYVDGVRYRNIPDTAEYVRSMEAGRSPAMEQERLDLPGRARETAMLELRLIEGIDRGRFEERFGVDPKAMFADAVREHEANGLLAVDSSSVRLTRAGLLVADSVIGDFVRPKAAV